MRFIFVLPTIKIRVINEWNYSMEWQKKDNYLLNEKAKTNPNLIGTEMEWKCYFSIKIHTH